MNGVVVRVVVLLIALFNNFEERIQSGVRNLISIKREGGGAVVGRIIEYSPKTNCSVY